MLTVVHDSGSSNGDAGASRSLLDEVVRDGARQMLAAALLGGTDISFEYLSSRFYPRRYTLLRCRTSDRVKGCRDRVGSLVYHRSSESAFCCRRR